jgi:quercetin dioxygenase-like cupin family protein
MAGPVEKPKSPDFLGAELPQDRALERGGRRLLMAVAELPLRYAPFFGRLAHMWQASEAQVQSELTRAKDPQSWRTSLLPGLKTFDLELQAERAVGHARLLHFAPGAHFPKHRHHGTEHVLVLEGCYADQDGAIRRAGDEQSMSPHSEHELRIVGDEPCVAAIVDGGVKFAPLSLLRALSHRAFKRGRAL